MTAVDLIKNAPILADRVDWARRGSSQYVADSLLSIEIKGDELDAASVLDDWAKAVGAQVVEIQRVTRRGKRVLYARLKYD